MRMLFAWAAFGGVIMLFQAVHVMRSGRIDPFFLDSAGPSLPRVKRLPYAALYGVPALFILALIVKVASLNLGRLGAGVFFRGGVLDLFGAGVLMAVAATTFVSPSIALGWARRAYPDINTSIGATAIVRFAAIGIYAIGAAILSYY